MPEPPNLKKGYSEAAIREILGPAGSSTPVLIIAAHMDDEAIGTAGMLKYLANVSVLHITDGAARNMRAARARGYETREGYARARGAELREALSRMRSAPMDIATLDVPDLDASYNLPAITHAVKEFILKARPGVIFTHPYEGGHPDHDSAAFAVAAACALISREGKNPPIVLEFTSYHGEGRKMVTAKFLHSRTGEACVELSEEERVFKEEMFSCYRTQKGALKNFPIGMERFRKAPVYDFSNPPHEGRLFYQRFDWGLPGRMWPSLAMKAMQELGLGEGRAQRGLWEISPRAVYRYMKYLKSRSAFF